LLLGVSIIGITYVECWMVRVMGFELVLTFGSFLKEPNVNEKCVC